MKLLLALIICAILTSCTLCRDEAIKDALYYRAQGWEAKVCTYDLKLDGLLWGGFVWTHHAQGCVWKDGEMKWVGMFGLADSPTFLMGRTVVQWDIEEYQEAVAKGAKEYIAQQGR